MVGRALIDAGAILTDVVQLMLPADGWAVNTERSIAVLDEAKLSTLQTLPESLIHIYRANGACTVSMIGFGEFRDHVAELSSRESRKLFLNVGWAAVSYLQNEHDVGKLTVDLPGIKERTLKTLWNAMCMRICC